MHARRKPSPPASAPRLSGKRVCPGPFAFTLVELLVVLAILGVLAALLFPLAGSVLDRAASAKCASNLRQIGIGLLAYAGEHDGDFPVAGGDVPHGSRDGSTGKPGWTEQIEPYMGSSLAVYRCPSCGKLHPNNSAYSYFLGAHAAYADGGEFGPVKLRKIARPSRYVLGGDITNSEFSATDADKDDYVKDCAFGGDVSKLHRGMANILFADGGVRAFARFAPGEMEIAYDDPDETY